PGVAVPSRRCRRDAAAGRRERHARGRRPASGTGRVPRRPPGHCGGCARHRPVDARRIRGGAQGQRHLDRGGGAAPRGRRRVRRSAARRAGRGPVGRGSQPALQQAARSGAWPGGADSRRGSRLQEPRRAGSRRRGEAVPVHLRRICQSAGGDETTPLSRDDGECAVTVKQGHSRPKRFQPGRGALPAAFRTPQPDAARAATAAGRKPVLSSRLPIAAIVAAILLFLAWSSIYVVNARQQAIVLRFGEIVDVKTEPGIYFKLPFPFMEADNVQLIEDRILRLDLDDIRVQVSGGKFYEVDAFVAYRISDPRVFRLTVSGSVALAEQRLRTRLDAALRRVYGLRGFEAALSEERAAMMQEVAEQLRPAANSLGLEIADVRIRRTDLTQEVSQQT